VDHERSIDTGGRSVSEPIQTRGRLYRSRTDRMLGGVAGGLGQYLNVDPVLVRLAFVALLLAGVGFFAYIIAWIIVPEEPVDATYLPPADPPPPPQRPAGSTGARMIFGSVLVAVGSLLLLDAVIPGNLFRLFWPMAIIAGGAGLLLYGVRR
jgi:phage shock protein C